MWKHSLTIDLVMLVHAGRISAVAALQYTDLVASGSNDGFIRLWKCGKDNSRLTEVVQVPVVGFVNALAFSGSGKFLVAAVGQENRLGRWQRSPEARNSIVIISITDGEALC